MGKVYAQHTVGWSYSGSVDKLLGVTSGSIPSRGYSRLIGGIWSSCTLTTGSGFMVEQSFDGGSHYDIVEKWPSGAASTASTYDIQVVGDFIKITASPGAANVDDFRAQFYLQPVASGATALKSGASDIGIVHVGTGTCSMGDVANVLNKVSASVSGGSVAALAGENHVGEFGGRVINVAGTLTRTNSGSIYAAGDAITDSACTPTAITFTNCARVAAGMGTIIGAHLVDNHNQTTALVSELWLYNTSPSPDADNAVFTPTAAELLKLVGIMQFNNSFIGDATAGSGGNQVNLASLTNYIPFVCAAADRNLYGLIVARNAYTGGGFTEVLTPVLRIIQD